MKKRLPGLLAGILMLAANASHGQTEEQFFTSPGSVSSSMKLFWEKVFTHQLGVAGGDYDGSDAITNTMDQTHYAQPNGGSTKQTLVGYGRSNAYSQDVHIQGNADTYISTEPTPYFSSMISNASNPFGHEYPHFPNWFPNLNLEVSIDYAGRNYVMEHFHETGRLIGSYGVWIEDRAHYKSPEIHNADQLWARYDAGSTSLIRLLHASDGSARFDGKKANTWAKRPSVESFAIAFKILPTASEVTYSITKALAKKVNAIADPASHRMYFNGTPLITVNESGFNEVDVQFENVYLDTDGYVKGFIVIKSSINQANNAGDAYLFLEVDKGGFIKGTPAIPSGFSVTNITNLTARFNWTGAGGNTSYLVQCKPSGNSNWHFIETQITTGNFKYVYGFTPNTSYEWRVIAYNNGNEYVSPTAGSFTTSNTAKPTPSGVNTTNVTSSSMQCNWNAVSGAIGYSVEYGRSFDPWITASPDSVTTTSLTLTNLLPGSSYTWRVFALFADGGYSSPAQHGYVSTLGAGRMIVSENGEPVSPTKPKKPDFLQPMDIVNTAALEMINKENLKVIPHTVRDMKLFPNPVVNELEVFIDQAISFSHLKLQVYDNAGQLVLEKQYNHFKRDFGIDCGKLKAGVYYLKAVIDNKAIMVEKFVKQ